MDDLETLVSEGRLREALNILEARRDRSHQREALRFRLEREAGDPLKARQGAEELLLNPRLAPKEKVACLDIVGRVLATFGSAHEGIRRLRSAFELACSGTGDALLQARQLASLVDALLHHVGIEPAVAEFGHLRRRAMQAGDALSLIDLHLMACEVLIKREERTRASTELKAAEGLLDRYPNLVQLAKLHTLKAILASAASQPREALDLARAALEFSERAGSIATEIPIRTNIAHLSLWLGELDECQAQLDRVLRLVRPGGGTEIGAYDTALQLAMARGDMAAATALAETVWEMSAKLDDGHSYYGLWHTLTRVRWLMRFDRADEAVTLALDALPRIVRMADRALLQRMRLLAAEGLARTNRAADGARLLADAVLGNHEPPLEMIAEAARVAGCVAAADNPGAAVSHFERATRVLATVGNTTARGEVILNAAGALAEGPGPPPWHELPALYRVPRSISFRFDTSQPLLSDTRPPTARSTETIAAMMDLPGHPPLLGHEVLALIVETDAAASAALVARAGAEIDVVSWTSCDPADARLLDRDATAVHIDLGVHHDWRYAIVARPAAAPSARATLVAIERLVHTARALYDARQREREQAALWPEQTPEQQLGLIVAAQSMVDLVKTTRRLAATSIPVLITGETGTGKELLARALHEASPHREQPFVPFNCTAVAREMLDAQLFGYRRGSFTGAQESFPGVIRAAAGGTLFLDEIGEVGADVQPKLLRFLESGEIHPLGEPRPIAVDVRIVAATNANLDQLVAEGRFREDLFYRLNVVRLQVPPLRERREEIPLLVEHFIEKYSRDARKAGLRVAEETMEYLALYKWPGNVRQLANELRRMVALAESGAVLMPEHLSREIAASRRTIPASERDLAPTELVVRLDQPLAAAAEHLERSIILHAIDATGGGMDEAARMLGLSRKGLYLKRQRLGLD